MAKIVKKIKGQTTKSQNSVKRATRQSSVATKAPSVKKTTVTKTASIKADAFSDKKMKNRSPKNQEKTAVHKKTASFPSVIVDRSKEKKKSGLEVPSRSKNIEIDSKVKKSVTPKILTSKTVVSSNTKALSGNVTHVSGERHENEEARAEELRETLLNRRHSILKWMDDDIDQEKTNDSGIVGDMVDAAQGSNENEMAFQLAEVESRELGQINIALGKIGDGSYGICEDCNGKISPARLKALPFATKCIKCQEAFDETHNGSGGQDDWGSAFRNPSSGDDSSSQEMD